MAHPRFWTDVQSVTIELTAVIQNHCGTIVGHWAGQMSVPNLSLIDVNLTSTSFAWDVINEPFNDDGTFREDIFFDTLRESFIPIALEAAKAADSTTKLYINEFNIEFAGPKATSLENLVTSLKANNTPVSDFSADDIGL